MPVALPCDFPAGPEAFRLDPPFYLPFPRPLAPFLRRCPPLRTVEVKPFVAFPRPPFPSLHPKNPLTPPLPPFFSSGPAFLWAAGFLPGGPALFCGSQGPCPRLPRGPDIIVSPGLEQFQPGQAGPIFSCPSPGLRRWSLKGVPGTVPPAVPTI